jgi:hypothetical protein
MGAPVDSNHVDIFVEKTAVLHPCCVMAYQSFSYGAQRLAKNLFKNNGLQRINGVFDRFNNLLRRVCMPRIFVHNSPGAAPCGAIPSPYFGARWRCPCE